MVEAMATRTATRVAFIRGINVGGRSSVAMAGLRAALEDRGFRNVRTYIQTGNVVYEPSADAKNTAAALRAEAAVIGGVIGAMNGFTPAVIVLAAADLATRLASSPYATADPSRAFLVFVDGDPAALADLDDTAAAGEEWQPGDGVIHLHCPNGVGRSKLWAKLAGSTKVPTTTRNLRTIAKVLDLAGS